MTEKDIERMLNYKSYHTEIIEYFKEREDAFVFETIVPFCEQTAKREISKADLQEAITVWMAYKDGKIVWQKIGKWARQTDDYHDYYECENCGIAIGLDDVKNYCPNCGAKMVADQEGECNG